MVNIGDVFEFTNSYYHTVRFRICGKDEEYFYYQYISKNLEGKRRCDLEIYKMFEGDFYKYEYTFNEKITNEFIIKDIIE